jgi:phosphomannomutase
MSQTEQSLSEIHQSLPQFEIVKNKVSLDGINPDAFIEKVSSLFDDADKNTLDGVKFTWEDRWVHLRKSNTEPIMRIYAEAPTKNGAEKLVIKIQSCL